MRRAERLFKHIHSKYFRSDASSLSSVALVVRTCTHPACAHVRSTVQPPYYASHPHAIPIISYARSLAHRRPHARAAVIHDFMMGLSPATEAGLVSRSTRFFRKVAERLSRSPWRHAARDGSGHGGKSRARESSDVSLKMVWRWSRAAAAAAARRNSP